MVSTNLVETNDLSICVLNIQAFNKDTNKIRKEELKIMAKNCFDKLNNLVIFRERSWNLRSFLTG
jgi:hypothetical protein